MPNCTHQHATLDTTPTEPACVELCEGKQFSLESLTEGYDEAGHCTFEWEVHRSDGPTFQGSTTVMCGSNKTVKFFCDRGQCVGFELHLQCLQDQPGPQQ